jgi:glutathione S-transferase
MKLHAHKVSTTSRPVLLFIAENKIDCEFVVVDLLSGEHVKEPFTKMNPSKQVPVLEDGDFVLTESSAILKYLAEKTGSPAYPKDLKQRARVNEAMDWLNTGFYREYGYHLIYPQLFPHHKRPTDEAHRGTIDWGKTKSAAALEILDKHYLPGPGPYLDGNDEPTIADFFGVAILTLGQCIGVGLSAYPNIERWIAAMKARPSWKETNEMFEGFAASLAGKPFETLGAVAS